MDRKIDKNGQFWHFNFLIGHFHVFFWQNCWFFAKIQISLSIFAQSWLKFIGRFSLFSNWTSKKSQNWPVLTFRFLYRVFSRLFFDEIGRFLSKITLFDDFCLKLVKIYWEVFFVFEIGPKSHKKSQNRRFLIFDF